ncbi:MAG: hypothetical protein ABTQ73_08990 [Caldilineales bacterium]
MAKSTYVDQISIQETTVGGFGNGLDIGLETVSRRGTYVDSTGHERTGTVARIAVSQSRDEPAESITVYEGMIFSVGEQRFQVIELKPNSSLSVKPGSSNGYITIGQLP